MSVYKFSPKVTLDKQIVPDYPTNKIADEFLRR